MDVFKSNRYPENFINNYFKTLLDNKRRIQETFYHFLPWIIIIATANKLRNSLNDILYCCKLQIVFKSQNKDNILKELTSGVVYKFCRECVGHLNVRTGERNVSIE